MHEPEAYASPIRVQFQLLVYYIYTIHRTDTFVLFGPFCLLSIGSETKREILLITALTVVPSKFPNLQYLELNLHFLLANNCTFSPFLRTISRIQIPPYSPTNVKQDRLNFLFNQSAYVKTCVRFPTGVHRWAVRAHASLKCRSTCSCFFYFFLEKGTTLSTDSQRLS